MPMPTHRAIAILVLALTSAAPAASAVEVRQGDDAPSYDAFLVRAYAPCLAPNAVTRGGAPACSPALTSACLFREGHLAITRQFETHRINAEVVTRPGGPPECATGTWYLDLVVRTTADSASACPGGHCTFPDTVLRLPMDVRLEVSDQKLNALLPFETSEPDVQILGATIVAPDGLPFATAATLYASATTRSNLTVPYEPCTDPGPHGACDASPWTSGCDFESGQIVWTPETPNSGGSDVRITLRDVAGTSPLCTAGTYHLDATVRVMQDTCTDGAPCTPVDRQVSVPLEATGETFDAEGSLVLSGLTSTSILQVVAARVLDPTGAPVAAAGLSEVRSLVKPRLTIGSDRLRMQATFPLPFVAAALDPLLDDGLTVDVTDRDGPVFSVTIPPERWQVQPPIGSRWDYKDRGGVLSGVTKARLKRILKNHRITGYELKLEARDVDLTAADFPGVTLHVTIPGSPSGVFQAQQHRTCKVKGPKMECR